MPLFLASEDCGRVGDGMAFAQPEIFSEYFVLPALRLKDAAAGQVLRRKSFLLYVITAAAEIGGCYSVYLWLRLDRTACWLIPGIAALGLFAWLLTLHPNGVGSGLYRLTAAFTSVRR